jgi:hypothetical protein
MQWFLDNSACHLLAAHHRRSFVPMLEQAQIIDAEWPWRSIGMPAEIMQSSVGWCGRSIWVASAFRHPAHQSYQ